MEFTDSIITLGGASSSSDLALRYRDSVIGIEPDPPHPWQRLTSFINPLKRLLTLTYPACHATASHSYEILFIMVIWCDGCSHSCLMGWLGFMKGEKSVKN